MIIIIENSEKIRVSKNKLVVVREDGKKEISLKDIKAVVIDNKNISISIESLLKLNEYKITTIICNHKHLPEIQILNIYSNYKITERLNEQIEWSQSRKTRAFRQIIIRKLSHQKDLLKYVGEFEAVEKLDNLIHKIRLIEKETKITNEKIRIIEGLGARIYFKSLFGKEFKRFEEDYINIGLNYGYTILRSLIIKVTLGKGLHPTLGLEHKNLLNNFNLVDDIIEVFRPLVDYAVYHIIKNKKEFNREYRNFLLKILYQEVEYDNCFMELEYAIGKYLDVLINYMNGKNKLFTSPKLVISRYEY